MAGPVPFQKGNPVSGGGPVIAAPAAPKVVAQNPAVDPMKVRGAPDEPVSKDAKPRGRPRRNNGQFQPLPAPKKHATEAAEQEAARDAENTQTEKGIAEIEKFISSKEGRALTTADSTQKIIDDGGEAKEVVAETPAAEVVKTEETAGELDEAAKKRALDAGFKAEELDGLTADEVNRQVVIRDRWIAEQGAKIAPVETKPEVEAPKVEAAKVPVKKVEKPIEVADDFDAELGEEVHETIREKFKGLHEHYKKVTANLKTEYEAKLAPVTEYIQKQEREQMVTKIDTVFAKHKEVLGETSIAKCDPSKPKDKLKLDVFQTAIGMEAYFKAHNMPVPSDEDLTARAVAAVLGINPQKKQVPPATVTARATSRTAPPRAEEEKDKISAIDNFIKSKGGF